MCDQDGVDVLRAKLAAAEKLAVELQETVDELQQTVADQGVLLRLAVPELANGTPGEATDG